MNGSQWILDTPCAAGARSTSSHPAVPSGKSPWTNVSLSYVAARHYQNPWFSLDSMPWYWLTLGWYQCFLFGFENTQEFYRIALNSSDFSPKYLIFPDFLKHFTKKSQNQGPIEVRKPVDCTRYRDDNNKNPPHQNDNNKSRRENSGDFERIIRTEKKFGFWKNDNNKLESGQQLMKLTSGICRFRDLFRTMFLRLFWQGVNKNVPARKGPYQSME